MAIVPEWGWRLVGRGHGDALGEAGQKDKQVAELLQSASGRVHRIECSQAQVKIVLLQPHFARACQERLIEDSL